MRVGILQCDHVVDDLIGRFGDYDEMFRSCLLQGHPQLQFRVYDLTRGEHPAADDDCDGYLITGSKRSVYEDEPWIEAGCELVRQLYQWQRPTIGICFGHQMIAQALGGRVEKAVDKGWGIGVHHWDIIDTPGWMGTPGKQFALLVSHQDQVTLLPENSRLLATSGFCPNAAFQVGETLLGIQGHPEFRPDYAAVMMQRRLQRIGAGPVAAASATLQQPLDDQLVADWMVDFINKG